MLHLTGDTESDVSLRSELKARNADVEVLRQPVDVLSEPDGSNRVATDLFAEIASDLQFVFLSEATACTNDDVDLGEVSTGARNLLSATKNEGLLGSRVSDGLDRVGTVGSASSKQVAAMV